MENSMPGIVLLKPDGEVYTYTQYTVRVPNGPRIRELVINDEPSNTQNSFGNDTDINTIMARFDRTGIFPQPEQPAQYADVTAYAGDITERFIQSQETIELANAFAASWTEKQELTEKPQSSESTPPDAPL